MSETTIYHNPRCSKSRAALALLEQQNTSVHVIKYLEQPLDENQVTTLLSQLNLGIRDMLRTGENDYKKHGFADADLSDKELILKLTEFPKVMQRPIISHAGRAVIGRPPENLLDLFK